MTFAGGRRRRLRGSPQIVGILAVGCWSLMTDVWPFHEKRMHLPFSNKCTMNQPHSPMPTGMTDRHCCSDDRLTPAAADVNRGLRPQSPKWWRWRESNPRPTTFRSSIYMLSRSLIFIDRSRTGTDRAHLFTLGFSVLASDLPLSRVDESRRLLPGHQHHRGNRSPGLSGEGVVSVVRN